MNKVNQLVSYGVIVVIVVSLLLLTQEHLTDRPHGIFLPATTSLVAQPVTAVKLYKQIPQGATVLGELHVMMHFTPRTKQNAQALRQYAAQLAAENGGSGIIVDHMIITDGQSMMQCYNLRAQVVK